MEIHLGTHLFPSYGSANMPFLASCFTSVASLPLLFFDFATFGVWVFTPTGIFFLLQRPDAMGLLFLTKKNRLQCGLDNETKRKKYKKDMQQ